MGKLLYQGYLKQVSLYFHCVSCMKLGITISQTLVNMMTVTDLTTLVGYYLNKTSI